MSNFFEELKNRNVYKVTVAYLVTAWLLLQIVDVVGPNLGWPDSVGAWLIKILIVGFPITLVLTWLYEFTPKGLKLTGKIQEDTEDNRRSGKRLNRTIIAALSLLVIAFLFDKLFISGPVLYKEQQTASVGVLPFANFSSDPEHGYFGDGLAEQILDELAGISGMLVPARTSAFAFKDKNQDIREIAEQLQVNYVLEGSTRFDSTQNRIRITVQLINAANGYHLWSNTYDAPFDSIFDIQEDISRKVARELQVRLLPNEDTALASQLTENTEAYKMYLKSREFSMKRDDENLGKAIEILNEALELDPEFAVAHAELSALYGLRFFYGNLSKKERDDKRAYHIKKAIELDSVVPEVLRAKAYWEVSGGGNPSKGIANLRRAIELKPNYADAHHDLYMYLSRLGRNEEAFKSLERAYELDPLNDKFGFTMANTTFYRLNKPEEGLRIIDQVIAQNPSNLISIVQKGGMLTRRPYGDLAGAFILYHKAIKGDPYERPNPMIIYSMDLDLDPVRDKYATIQKLQYPDNEDHTFWNILFIHWLNKDFQEAKNWIRYWEKEKDLDPEIVETELAWIDSALGNHQPIIKILENSYPEFRNQPLGAEDLSWGTARDLVDYIELLRLTENHEAADQLANTLCAYFEERNRNEEFLYEGQKVKEQLYCYYSRNDVVNFSRVLENSYFVRKDRIDVFSDLKVGTYRLFEDEPVFISLKEKITKDVHRQRAEIIAYLKEEGDWDPAWDKELGLE